MGYLEDVYAFLAVWAKDKRRLCVGAHLEGLPALCCGAAELKGTVINLSVDGPVLRAGTAAAVEPVAFLEDPLASLPHLDREYGAIVLSYHVTLLYPLDSPHDDNVTDKVPSMEKQVNLNNFFFYHYKWLVSLLLGFPDPSTRGEESPCDSWFAGMVEEWECWIDGSTQKHGLGSIHRITALHLQLGHFMGVELQTLPTGKKQNSHHHLKEEPKSRHLDVSEQQRSCPQFIISQLAWIWTTKRADSSRRLICGGETVAVFTCSCWRIKVTSHPEALQKKPGHEVQVEETLNVPVLCVTDKVIDFQVCFLVIS